MATVVRAKREHIDLPDGAVVWVGTATGDRAQVVRSIYGGGGSGLAAWAMGLISELPRLVEVGVIDEWQGVTDAEGQPVKLTPDAMAGLDWDSSEALAAGLIRMFVESDTAASEAADEAGDPDPTPSPHIVG
jgi:hypothetical protein